MTDFTRTVEEGSNPAFPLVRALFDGGTPDRIRTGATALRGRRARPLHNGGERVNTRGTTLAKRLRGNKIPAVAGILAGVLGLEPRLTGPEPVVLPITPYPNG
jgi:hypothetical protein